MKKITLAFTFLVLSGLGCSVGSSKGQDPNAPKPIPSPTVAPGSTAAQFTSQTASYGVKNVVLSGEAHFQFFDSNSLLQAPPVDTSYSIKAYSDSACNTPSTGTLTYTKTKTTTEVKLTNVKYTQAEDFYIGVQGTLVVKGCSSVMNIVSSVPTNFSISSGDGQAGVVNSNLANPVVFQVFDATNNLVQNARIKVQNQVSNPSDVSGLASITLKVGTVTGDLGYDCVLSYGGTDVDTKSLPVTVLPGVGASFTVALQDPNTSVQVNTLSNPIFLMALDQYLNPVHPSSYSFSWSTYLDSGCTVPGPDVSGSFIEENPVISPSDTSTWTNLFFFSFGQVGTYYLKFSLTSPDVGTVCSQSISVTP